MHIYTIIGEMPTWYKGSGHLNPFHVLVFQGPELSHNVPVQGTT